MADTIPPLPAGFELEQDQPVAQSDIPPLPEGFELEGGDDRTLNIDITGGVRESQMAAAPPGQPDSTAPDGWEYGTGRDIAFGGRSVIQGAGSLLGAVGGDAFNNYIANPIARQLGMQEAQPYAQEAAALADRIGLPKAQTPTDRVLGDIGEGLTGTALGFGAGGLARSASAPVANALGTLGEAPAAAQPVVNALANQTLANPGLQVASTIGGSGAAGTVREQGGGTAAQLAAGLVGGIAPAAVRVGAPAVAGGILSGTVPEQRAQLARQALDRGIELTPAQLSDSRFLKFAHSALRSVPFTGAAKRSERQAAQFNKAVANAIGESADNVDSQVYARAKERQSELFNELTSRNAINVDDKMLRSIENISNNANVNRDAKAAIEDALEYLYSQSTTGPKGVVIPGRAYQELDSTLGQLKKSGGSQSYYIGQLQDAIRAGMDRSVSPQDAQAWRQLRREYGNRKTIAPLVAAAGDEGVSPARVLAAASNNAASKEAMASGTRGELGTLGNIGRLMREPPSSGTAERVFVGSLFGGAGLANPAIAALSATAAQLASRGLDSRTIARMMIQENPGLSAEDAERIVAQALIPATSNAAQIPE